MHLCHSRLWWLVISINCCENPMWVQMTIFPLWSHSFHAEDGTLQCISVILGSGGW